MNEEIKERKIKRLQEAAEDPWLSEDKKQVMDKYMKRLLE